MYCLPMGPFGRFFRPDSSRVRNGFFLFDEQYPGGTQIIHTDMDNNGKRELLVAKGNRIQIWRDDGLLYMKKYPYTANYKGTINIAVGDLNEDGRKEVYVSPGAGNALPIKIYTRHGRQIKRDWYPFGVAYNGGITMDVRHVQGRRNNELIIGTGSGHDPIVHIFDRKYNFVTAWHPFELSVRGGVSVAAGDLDGDNTEEIIIGAGPGAKPRVRIFNEQGTQLYNEFTAYSSFTNPGVQVRAVDVDFDGRDDIVTLSDSF